MDKVQSEKQIVEYYLQQLLLDSDNLWIYRILLYKNQHTWIILSSTSNISEIYYLQLLKYFLAYFYPHLGLHYYVYSAVLHNQEHLHLYSSIPLFFD